jgi:thiosulfate/3-mercaptopyruvate sulfurtransferase
MPNASILSPLISAGDIPFKKRELVIVDARSGPDADQRYIANHLKGAFHADLDRDLSRQATDPAYGGRHPLPEVKDFAILLGNLGITASSHVIVYDDKGGANAAARFWWMLRAVGHPFVQLVDGGLDAIIRHRLPMSNEKHEPPSGPTYPANVWQLPLVTLEDVKAAVNNPDALVIDVREKYRYVGEREPIDLVAGHIPGAINIPYLNNLADNGLFRSATQLASEYVDAIGYRDPANVIVHCGSGVTACHTLLALEHAGISGASLYVGSWGEWSRRDLPIATGSE